MIRRLSDGREGSGSSGRKCHGSVTWPRVVRGAVQTTRFCEGRLATGGDGRQAALAGAATDRAGRNESAVVWEVGDAAGIRFREA